MREKARKLRGRLCSAAEVYKGVLPEVCQSCASACEYGMELLDILGMEKPQKENEIKRCFQQDRRMRKIIRGMNRRWRR